jgi:sterol desaturase/sphingolipid hydroxylase (fatty acid hydroxylase superfamily)
VFGLFSAVAGGTPEAAIGAMAINALYQSMVHSMTDWSPKWLEYIFITPATHRVHHSMNPTHFNKNFGTLSFWDKLFGTYHPPDEVTSFGVDDRENFNHDRFGAEIFLVVKRWIRTLLQT